MSASQKSQGYQPKKLLKLPKEMPSNIVSRYHLVHSNFGLPYFLQIIKSDSSEPVSVPYQMNQTE